MIDKARAHHAWDLPEVLFKAETDDRTHPDGFRKAYFLAAHDKRDGSYFLCELPKVEGKTPRTLADAYELLKPEPVLLAEQMKRRVKRQGDMFLVPTKTFKPTKGRHRTPGFLLRKNHMATDVFVVGDTTYARGKVRHAPSGRRADHASVRLGRRWHLVVQNTVPLVR